MPRGVSPQSGNPQLASIHSFFQISLLGLVASGYLALAGSGFLDLPSTLAAGLAVGGRLLLVSLNRELPLPERWVNALSVAYVGFYPLDIYFVSGEFLAATVHLVLFLAIIRILTARSARDHLFVVVIAFLELLAASLLSTRLNYFIFLALFLLFAVAAFASWEIRRSASGCLAVARSQREFAWRLAGLGVTMSAGILLFTAGLFFVLPRTARAAFERLVPERFHISAFSNQVSLGELAEVKQQSTVLMHARIAGFSHPRDLKWRGNALSEFDGRRWYNEPRRGQPLRVQGGTVFVASDEQRRLPGRRLSYEIQLKSFGSETLFIAGRPELLRIDAPMIVLTSEGSYRANFRSPGAVRYGVYSYIDEDAPAPAAPPHAAPAPSRRYLALPALDPRIEDLTRRLTSAEADPVARARILERFLRTRFEYAIEETDPYASDPIAEFLFQRKRGHCEYFASAMAVMLRSIGTPSRVAIGFQSGMYNPISGWYVIRASDAHSWVEAWFPGRGWLTFDPTPAAAVAPGAGLLARVGLLLDAADTFWQEWVVEYDLNRQLFLASHMERSRRRFSFGWWDEASDTWRDIRTAAGPWFRRYGWWLAGAAAVALLVIPLAGHARRWWRQRRPRARLRQGRIDASDATMVYLHALDLLERRGHQRPPWLAPREFLRHIGPAPVAAALGTLTSDYQELRFGGHAEAASRLVASAQRFEAELKSRPVTAPTGV